MIAPPPAEAKTQLLIANVFILSVLNLEMGIFKYSWEGCSSRRPQFEFRSLSLAFLE